VFHEPTCFETKELSLVGLAVNGSRFKVFMFTTEVAISGLSEVNVAILALKKAAVKLFCPLGIRVRAKKYSAES